MSIGQPAAAATKPTIVLVHGAWADGSSWNTVIKLLQDDGYTVLAPPNELRGPANDASVISTLVKSIPGPVILVGHSYGGFVIGMASAGNANVKALVYVDAFVPDGGDTLTSLLASSPAPPKDLFVPVPFTTPTGKDVDLYFNTKYFAPVFASDVPAAMSSLMAVTQRPLTASAFIEKAPDAEGWKSIPSWYVVGDADLVIPPAAQMSMATHAKAHISHVPGGSHPSMIVHPEATVAAIEAAAAATMK
ncbi:MAG TPA: alpha/beta hydrolase [Candidatus Tumulicola sp.]|jgi:pimeloyl-ACP methyl ester carboxylesterase